MPLQHLKDIYISADETMNLASELTTTLSSPRRKRLKLNQFYLFTEKPIGKGTFSSVYLCQDEQRNSAACKVINKSSNKGTNAWEVAKSQVTIIKNLRHPSVVRYLGSFESQNNFYILLRYYQGSTLRQILNKDIKLPMRQIINITVQIINVLEYLYSKRIVHRDLKPENIKYTRQNVVLLDFGFATTVNNMETSQLSERLGTVPYMCPEIMGKKKYTSRCQIWGLGVIVYELVYGHPPWKCRDQHELMRNIYEEQLEFPSHPTIPKRLKQLIIGCLKLNPSYRFPWSTVFEYSNVEYLSQGYFKARYSDSLFCCMNTA